MLFDSILTLLVLVLPYGKLGCGGCKSRVVRTSSVKDDSFVASSRLAWDIFFGLVEHFGWNPTSCHSVCTDDILNPSRVIARQCGPRY